MARQSAPGFPNPFAPVVMWHTPDWTPDGSEHLPVLRHDHAELLEQCRTALARREQAYPALVERGQMDAGEAAADIAAWRDLLACWAWVVTGEGEPAELPALPGMVAAIDLALSRIEGELTRGRTGEANLYQHQLLIALRWHAELEGHLALHRSVRLTRELRARAFCPACERRAEDPATNACTRTDCGLPRTAKRTGSRPNDERKAA